jgi:hypothetical protein
MLIYTNQFVMSKAKVTNTVSLIPKPLSDEVQAANSQYLIEKFKYSAQKTSTTI